MNIEQLIKIGSKKYNSIDIPLLVPFGTESFSCFGKYKEIIIHESN